MAKYKVTHNVLFEEKHFTGGEVVELSVKEADELNGRGQVSHPELSPFLIRLDDKKAAKEEAE